MLNNTMVAIAEDKETDLRLKKLIAQASKQFTKLEGADMITKRLHDLPKLGQTEFDKHKTSDQGWAVVQTIGVKHGVYTVYRSATNKGHLAVYTPYTKTPDHFKGSSATANTPYSSQQSKYRQPYTQDAKPKGWKLVITLEDKTEMVGYSLCEELVSCLGKAGVKPITSQAELDKIAELCNNKPIESYDKTIVEFLPRKKRTSVFVKKD